MTHLDNKNNCVKALIKQSGYRSVMCFCDVNNVHYSHLMKFISGNDDPFSRFGRWKPIIVKVANLLAVHPEDLFPVRYAEVRDKIHEAEVVAVNEVNQTLTVPPDVAYEESDLRQHISQLMTTLSPQDLRVINLRFGFHTGEELPLRDLGKILNLSAERVRQIEMHALRHLNRRCHNNGSAEKLLDFLRT